MDYTALAQAIEQWLQKPEVEQSIPTFIKLTEARINREIRVRQMETRAGAVISTQFSTLPDDFLEMRNIQVNSQPVIALKYVTPQHADEIRATNLQGKPQFFSVVANRLELIPAPSGPYDVEMVYYSKVPALTSQTTSNWLSSAHPDVYLYGCLAQASLFLDKDASAWVTLYDSAVSEMYMENERSQFHGTTPCVRGIRIG